MRQSLLCAVSLLVMLPFVAPTARAQQRHLGQGKHEQLLREGQKAEQAGDEARERKDTSEANKHYRKAITLYTQAWQVKADYLPVYVRLSRVYLVMSKHRAAMSVLKRALLKFPDNIDLKEQLALHQILGGYKRQGIANLEEVIKKRPNKLPLLVELANHYRDSKQPKRAVPVLERILALRPRAYNRRVELGRALIQLRRYDDALASFRQVPAGKFYLPARVGVADLLRRRGDAEKALAIYNAVEHKLPAGPKRKHVALGIAHSLRMLGRHEKALERYIVYNQRSPGDSRGFYGAGMSLLAQGRPKQAVKQLEYANQRYPGSTRILSALARGYLAVGKIKGAMAVQKRAVALAPKDWHLHSAMGQLQRRAGDVQGALSVHRKLASSRAWSAKIAAEIGHDYYYLGKLKQARAAYKRALSRKGQRRHKRAARIGLVLIGLREAEALIGKRRLPQAEAMLEKLLRHKQLTGRVYEVLAAIALERGNEKRALSLLGKARGGTALAALVRAHAALRAGKAPEAMKALATINLGDLSSASARVVLLTRAAAEIATKRYDDAIRRLKGLKGKARAELLAFALLERANQRYRERRPAPALNDLTAFDRLKRRASRAEKKRVALLRSLAAAETGNKAAALKSLKRFKRMRRPEILEPRMRSGQARALLEAYILMRVGAHQQAMKLAGRSLRGRSRGAALPIYRAAAATLAYGFLARGNSRQAGRALAALQKQVKTLNAKEQLLAACVAYAQGRKNEALKSFRALSGKLPEAQLDLGIYFDEVKRDKKAAFNQYVAYVRRKGRVALPRVRRWIEIKRRVFKF
ncbi:MAG: tetratricopeptide repeat protein [Myxococcales bacterium]|nr:tetratricopeptide repeat protein [Myxococcales bacterium]